MNGVVIKNIKPQFKYANWWDTTAIAKLNSLVNQTTPTAALEYTGRG